MRFMEIANPEDQLALWKLISDKMWAAFAQRDPHAYSTQVPQSSTMKGRVASPARPVPRPITKTSHKASSKSKAKAVKPRRAPMAPPPKPLPKPQQLQPTPTQSKQAQTQQHQQLAQQIHQAFNKKSPGPTQPQPIQPKAPVAAGGAP